MPNPLREIVQKIVDDAFSRFVAMKPSYDSVDLGVALLGKQEVELTARADRAEFALAILAEIVARRMAEVHTLLLPMPVEDEYGVARDATDQQKAVRHDMIRKLFLT